MAKFCFLVVWTVSFGTFSFGSTCNEYMPGDIPCPAAHSFFPDIEDCTKYWECTHKCAEKRQCPSGYLYDSADQTCRSSSLVNCSSRPCNDPAHCDGRPDCGHAMDCSDKQDGWYPDAWNCRKYTHCLNGQGEHLTCEGHLLYEPNKIWCDHPQSVDCGERPICDDCDGNCHSQNSCTHQCTEDGDFAEECCGRSFCKCLNGHGTLVECQPGLVFNQSKDWCDYPSNIPCCNQQ